MTRRQLEPGQVGHLEGGAGALGLQKPEPYAELRHGVALAEMGGIPSAVVSRSFDFGTFSNIN